jgi:hypothetical protein
MVKLGAISYRSADIDCFQVVEGFVEDYQVVIREFRQLDGLGARARVRDDVPALLKRALERSAHPVIAAGDQGEWWPIQWHLHGASSSAARLAWRDDRTLAS